MPLELPEAGSRGCRGRGAERPRRLRFARPRREL